MKPSDRVQHARSRFISTEKRSTIYGQTAHLRQGNHRRRSGSRSLRSGSPCRIEWLKYLSTIAGITNGGEYAATIRIDPTVTIVSVSQNDNYNYCKCEKCATVDAEEGSHMGTMLRFVNADRLPYVQRSRMQWRYIKLMLHPNTEEGKNLLNDVIKYDLKWSEGVTVPPAPDLSKTPDLWREG